MNIIHTAALLCVMQPVGGLALAAPSSQISKLAKKLTAETMIVDGHNDLPWALRVNDLSDLNKIDLSSRQETFHTDIPRLREGGVGLQFWSAYVPAKAGEQGNAVEMTLEQIDLIHRMIENYPKDFTLAATADEAEEAFKNGKIASMIGVEGGYSINRSLAILRVFQKLGVRYMTLTHNKTIEWADSATDDEKHGGLTEFGKTVVSEMNRLGIMVDISHVSSKTMIAAIKVSKSPVIASHSSARYLDNHPRNIGDDVLQLIAKNDGLVMVNFYSGFINKKAVAQIEARKSQRKSLLKAQLTGSEIKYAMQVWDEEHPLERGSVEDILAHIDHIRKVAGINHVGLGSDFDGVPTLPRGLGDVSGYARITQGLLDLGYSIADVRKVLGGNAIRVIRKNEQVARAMQNRSL